MEIAPQYKKMIESALNSIEMSLPISFIGMGGCGRSFVFSYLNEKNLGNDAIYLDISAANADLMFTTNILWEELTVRFPESKSIQERTIETAFSFISTYLADNAEKKLTLVVNTPNHDSINDNFLRKLSSTGYRFMNRLNYIFFMNVKLLSFEIFKNSTLRDLVTSHIVPVRPHEPKGAHLVLDNFKELYKKQISKKLSDEIIDLSGGNPGLIKVLYLQVLHDESWSSPNYNDIQLIKRLKVITSSLTDAQLKSLQNVNPVSADDISFLKFYGYLNPEQRIFSKVLEEYIRTSNSDEVDPVVLYLNETQRKMYRYFMKNRNIIVSRDQVARELWGNSYEEKYSDWALDQFIHELRNVFTKLGNNLSLKTKRGEGYIFIDGSTK